MYRGVALAVRSTPGLIESVAAIPQPPLAPFVTPFSPLQRWRELPYRVPPRGRRSSHSCTRPRSRSCSRRWRCVRSSAGCERGQRVHSDTLVCVGVSCLTQRRTCAGGHPFLVLDRTIRGSPDRHAGPEQLGGPLRVVFAQREICDPGQGLRDHPARRRTTGRYPGPGRASGGPSPGRRRRPTGSRARWRPGRGAAARCPAGRPVPPPASGPRAHRLACLPAWPGQPARSPGPTAPPAP